MGCVCGVTRGEGCEDEGVSRAGREKGSFTSGGEPGQLMKKTLQKKYPVAEVITVRQGWLPDASQEIEP